MEFVQWAILIASPILNRTTHESGFGSHSDRLGPSFWFHPKPAFHVAGNRESKAPGIEDRVERYMRAVFKHLGQESSELATA